jgi:hypothetical protein
MPGPAYNRPVWRVEDEACAGPGHAARCGHSVAGRAHQPLGRHQRRLARKLARVSGIVSAYNSITYESLIRFRKPYEYGYKISTLVIIRTFDFC